MGEPGLRVVVLLASAGRSQLLGDVIEDIRAQTWRDLQLVLSVPDESSLPTSGIPADAVVVHDRGLAAQRNAGLVAVPDATHVFCFDDDAVVRPDFVASAMDFFDRHPEVVALTGRVLADGATGSEISRSTAQGLLTQSATVPATGRWSTARELYGCNFAFRPPALGHQRFDGRLPLYSWLEDHDFARRAMRHGVLARVEDCVIVHRGAKSGGRTAHLRLGYSQVMNPAYLWRMGSFPLWLAVWEIVPRCAKNVVKSFVGDEGRWRQERTRGNLLAVADVLRGRLTPERIVDLPPEG